MKTGRFIVFTLLWLLVAAGVVAVGVGWQWKTMKTPLATAGTGKPVRVTVPRGATIKSIGQSLEEKKVIRSAWAFSMIARESTIKPGVYDLNPEKSVEQVLAQLIKGDIVKIKVTFPEGWRLEQMAARLSDNKLCSEQEFLDFVRTKGDTLSASFKPPMKLEGYLFPATYEFPVGADVPTIAGTMLGIFDKVVAKGKADEIKASGRSLADIVNIAAMIEREARVKEDRPRIASVIYNRLQANMLLQIDATVQYALPEHKSRLLYRDLEIDSPYNTYKYRGLPAGPICNPGLDCIEAALAPDKTNYLYYVARADGSHLFGRTAAEHQANIAIVRGRAPVAATPVLAPTTTAPRPGIGPAVKRAPVRRRVRRFRRR